MASSGVFAGFVASSGVFAGFAASSEVVTGFTPSSEIVEVFVVVAGVFVTPTQTPSPWGRGFSVVAVGLVASSEVVAGFPPPSGVLAGFSVPMLLGVASAGFVWWAEAHPTDSADGVPSDVFAGFTASSEVFAGFCRFSSAIR